MTALSDWIAANQEAAWAAVQTDPQWAWIKANSESAADLAPLVERMGWETDVEAINALGLLNLTVKPLPSPSVLSFDRGDLVTVAWDDMVGMVELATSSYATTNNVMTDGSPYHRSDATYGLLTESQIMELADKLPSVAFDYQAITMDCEDFCDVAQGWLAEQGLGNAAIATAIFRLYDNGSTKAIHAALLAVETDGDLWWIEPQDGEVYELLEFEYIYPSADYAKITDLFF